MSCCFWPNLFLWCLLNALCVVFFFDGQSTELRTLEPAPFLKLNLATFFNGTLFLTELCPIFNTVQYTEAYPLNYLDSAACPFSSWTLGPAPFI